MKALTEYKLAIQGYVALPPLEMSCHSQVVIACSLVLLEIPKSQHPSAISVSTKP